MHNDNRLAEVLESPLYKLALLALVDLFSVHKLAFLIGQQGIGQSERNQQWTNTIVSLRNKLQQMDWLRRCTSEGGHLYILQSMAKISRQYYFDEDLIILSKQLDELSDVVATVASAIIALPTTEYWWQPVDCARQVFVDWQSPEPENYSGSGGGAIQMMPSSKVEPILEEGRGQAYLPGSWWSVPDWATTSWTVRQLADFPSLALVKFADTLFPLENTQAAIRLYSVKPGARVLEICSLDDWGQMVEHWPTDVSDSHGAMWKRWFDVDGPWFVPNWNSIRESYDGVHVTVGAIVRSGGLVRPLRRGHTCLIGWVPDATLWLTDQLIGGEAVAVIDWDGHEAREVPEGVL